MMAKRILPSLIAGLAVLSSHVSAFTTVPQGFVRRDMPTSTRLRAVLPTVLKVIGGSAARKMSKTTLAGKIVPVLKKFAIGPQKAQLILENIVHHTDWGDIILLAAFAYGASPMAKVTYNRLGAHKLNIFEDSRRASIASNIAQLARVAMTVYAVDMIAVTLSTLGFQWVDQVDLSGSFLKMAYTAWGVLKLLEFKKAAICKAFDLPEDKMGKWDVPNRIIDGFVVAMASLVVFDWLSIKMGLAVRGLFAFGSVGTLAFTFASQGLLTQFMSGIFLILSNKMYVGDYVAFGDNTKGVITKLGWMDTTIRQADNTMLKVPNAALATQKVSNVSRVRQCQVSQTLRVHYDDVDKIPQFIKSVKKEIKAACPRLIFDGTRPFRVYWTEFNPDHLEIQINTHHNIAPLGDAYWRNRQEVLMAIARAVKKHDILLTQMRKTPATAAAKPTVHAKVVQKDEEEEDFFEDDDDESHYHDESSTLAKPNNKGPEADLETKPNNKSPSRDSDLEAKDL